MKNTICICFLLISVIILITSCSNDDSSTMPVEMLSNRWQLDDYNFSSQISTTYVSGEPFTAVSIDSNISNENGLFKSCNLVLTFNTSTTGYYTVKSLNSLVSDVLLKNLSVRCIVTDVAGHGAVYESVDSNVTAVVAFADGKFVISIPQAIAMTLLINNDLANAPESMTFKCNEVH
jgi:hypothetical protein